MGEANETLADGEPWSIRGDTYRSFQRSRRWRHFGRSFRRSTLMFKRASVRYGRTPAPETPYQKAAQVWDERIGSARIQAFNWRLMAFGCLIMSGGLASALVWQSLRGTVTPWVVQIDRLGQAQAVGPADSSYQPTDPQIAFPPRPVLSKMSVGIASLTRSCCAKAGCALYDFTTVIASSGTSISEYAPGPTTPLPISASCRYRSRFPASSGRRRPPFASPGSSAHTRTVASARPSVGPPSSPL